MGSEVIVEAHGVSKRFGRHLAVDDLSLDVPRGSCFGLLGPNGAGKTTTLRMIYGVTRPTSGEVRVFGIDVARRPRDVRARLGVTLQENVLVDVLDARENLRIFGRYHRLREPELTHRADELIDLLELRSHVGFPVKTLSGGFKRRLAIAMALVNRPELLILDEPTTGLDPAVRLALWGRVRELRRQGTSVLLTTHYMDEAERLCDEVAIVADGRVILQGAPRALIERTLAVEAVEIDCTPDEENALLGEPRPGERRLRVGPRVIGYTDDATPIVDRVHHSDGGDRRPIVVRPTNLEDVFLAATGTRLDGNA